jgi:DMSO reductase family type II enzyme heme b subunit
MKATKVSNVGALLEPAAKEWQSIEREVVDLAGMPLHVQTSRYVRTVWADKLVGKVRAVSVRAAHDGERVAFQLEWNDDTQNSEFGERLFPDAAAVLFPCNGNTSITTLGSADAGVNEWFWRADLERPENLVAHGLGTDTPAEGAAIEGGARWDQARWSLVLSRQLKTKGAENVKLAPGKKVNVGFSIWEGSNRERGDLRSYSRQWRELTLEP